MAISLLIALTLTPFAQAKTVTMPFEAAVRYRVQELEIKREIQAAEKQNQPERASKLRGSLAALLASLTAACSLASCATQDVQSGHPTAPRPAQPSAEARQAIDTVTGKSFSGESIAPLFELMNAVPGAAQ